MLKLPSVHREIVGRSPSVRTPRAPHKKDCSDANAVRFRLHPAEPSGRAASLASGFQATRPAPAWDCPDTSARRFPGHVRDHDATRHHQSSRQSPGPEPDSGGRFPDVFSQHLQYHRQLSHSKRAFVNGRVPRWLAPLEPCTTAKPSPTRRAECVPAAQPSRRRDAPSVCLRRNLVRREAPSMCRRRNRRAACRYS